MLGPGVSYRTANLLADAGRWADLLDLAADDRATPEADRREVAHIVALEAPPPIAVAAAELFPADDNRHPGPLWEVVAHRPWRELDGNFTDPLIRQLAAQTRVLRGEDLRGVAVSPIPPLNLQSWEAAHWNAGWDMPEYGRTGSSAGSLWSFPDETLAAEPLPAIGAERVDHSALPILGSLSSAAEVYAFRGTARAAAATLAASRDGCLAAAVPLAVAYPHLVHLAAGIGAYECPSGQATGRIAVWRALTAMAGLPANSEPRLITAFVERLRCVGWRHPAEPLWHLRLAVEDPEQGVSWALTADDSD
ncbi:hypothetical protein [Paractinoplanes maris]|uniref:hypothetical protein n=1 Tax=Paractinoplanes maris TaxID=1734446 RepID=UPI00202029B8|nr:hypothetical protein [Actinoplanes maris]